MIHDCPDAHVLLSFMMQSTDYYTNSYLSNWQYEQIRKDKENHTL